MQNEELNTTVLPNTALPQAVHSPTPDAAQQSPFVRRAPGPVEAAEITRRGWELYQQNIQQAIEPRFIGMFISIDVDTGEYVVADDHLGAAKQLIAKKPDARIYSTRVGSKEMYRMYGARGRT